MVTNPTKLGRFLTVGAKYVLAAVFASSGIAKLTSPSNFIAFVSSFEWLGFLNPMALLYSFVVLELAIAILILFPTTCRLGSVLSFATLFLLSVVLIHSSQADANISCGCFGDLLPENSIDISILRNMAFLVVSAVVAHQGRE